MENMGRPRKEKSQLMIYPLRIMLTASQQKLIRQAAAAAGTDITAWARPILLEAARADAEQRNKAPARKANS